jgi:O-antigen ligase
MTALATAARIDRAFLLRLADWLAAAVGFVLPWSTTATGICIAVWLLVLLPTLDVATVRRELVTAAGGLPVLLWCLGVVGMLWADVDWTARLGGVDSFNRLLMIPLLLAQFRRSEHGGWVICAFLVSSAVVLIASFVLVLTPGLTWRGKFYGIPAHDDIYQSTAFLICGFGALGYAALEGTRRHWRAVLAFLAIGALFFANFGFVLVSRSALAVAPVLALLLGWRLFRWKGILAACIAGAVVCTTFWAASPVLRARTYASIDELQQYRATNEMSSIGLHLAFLTESVAIIRTAPIIGHGTGSIGAQFRNVTAGGSGASSVASVNPHNQTFAVAIQIGLLGALVLWAMWTAHFMLFRGAGLAAWLGMVVVVENILSSTVHSHLFDFTNGWLYVFGVGVLGGMVLRKRAEPSPTPAPAGLANIIG